MFKQISGYDPDKVTHKINYHHRYHFVLNMTDRNFKSKKNQALARNERNQETVPMTGGNISWYCPFGKSSVTL